MAPRYRPRAAARRVTGTRALAGLVVTAVLLVLAACSGQGDEPEAESSGDQSVFPLHVEHKYGTTEITEQAERVVTLGLSDQEPVLALGIQPVGVVDWFGERPYGNWPWTQPLWEGQEPTIVGERDDYNLEAIAELRPDLIIAQYSGMNEEQYETLSEIAPVVAQSPDYGDYAAPWQEQMRRIGRALGMEDRAEELITGVDEQFAAVRAEHPEFAEQTTAVADSYIPGEFVAFAPTDPKMLFMTELGFQDSAEIAELAGDTSNAAEFSAERLDLLEVDRLVWLQSDAASQEQVKANELYQELRVAQEGRDVFLTYTDPPIGAAMSFNTVLSIPYALEEFVPLLTDGG